MSISNPLLMPGAPTQWGEAVIHLQDGSDGSVLDGLTITGGHAELAGGVWASSHDVLVRRCTIRDNFASGAPSSQGAGGVLGTGNLLTIVDSRVIGNDVSEGASGIRVHQGMLVLSNTLVADNRGDMAVHLNGAATLMNVTIANNDGGVLLNTDTGGTLSITNSIVYLNGWSIGEEGNAVVQVAYSDVEGGWPGTGNLDADPGFVDPAGGDYHLQVGSPCIDSGTADGAPDHDLDGVPRPQNMAYDMGAYEWVGFRIFLPLVMRQYP
jgi:hypothetical protein